MPLIYVDTLDDPRLDAFARLTEAQLRSKLEPERALFIAESQKVIERAFEGGMEPISLLMEEKWLPSMAPLIERMEKRTSEQTSGEGLPVFVAPHDELERLTGFELTRGALGAFRRPALPAVGHGDAHGEIAAGDGGGGEPLALGAEQQRQLRRDAGGGFALGQERVQLVGGHRVVGERHGGAGEAMGAQLGDALIAPGAAAGAVRYVCVADAGPRHLEDCAHGYAHGPAVQRVVAGGTCEHGVHAQGRSAAEDGPDVGVVRDVPVSYTHLTLPTIA